MPQPGKDVGPKRLLIAPQRRGLVPVTAPRPNNPRSRRRAPVASGLLQRHTRRSSQQPMTRRRLRLSTPRPRIRESPERLAHRAPIARGPYLRLIARPAITNATRNPRTATLMAEHHSLSAPLSPSPRTHATHIPLTRAHRKHGRLRAPPRGAPRPTGTGRLPAASRTDRPEAPRARGSTTQRRHPVRSPRDRPRDSKQPRTRPPCARCANPPPAGPAAGCWGRYPVGTGESPAETGDSALQRRGRDSNSRYANKTHNGFRDRLVRPVSHPLEVAASPDDRRRSHGRDRAT